jgi:large subunit ribosomal protein L17
MRHARRNQRLSRPTEARDALVSGLVRNLVIHDRITTTFARAKEAQRLADRLVTWGKDGSVHARRQAFRILQDRTLVQRLFADVAPRFLSIRGGYTRVVRLDIRRGDGAQTAQLAFSLLPAIEKVRAQTKSEPPQTKAPAKGSVESESTPEPKKGKGILDGIRELWTRKKKGSG